ncbi:MAG: hypothetical protein AVDCRST_MAG96-2869 [uncultured Segetibacter sp.]|uniref:Uncharacterized protein n=1 Tax=uncultured Segetibacter sp. TaxID=481133 RepID=A0A6J4TDJ3_9BACT|nr:MAG: hypothetical protein AVDCRST_MAG96-2869 [uncultured Segetibacter sp.]
MIINHFLLVFSFFGFRLAIKLEHLQQIWLIMCEVKMKNEMSQKKLFESWV